MKSCKTTLFVAFLLIVIDCKPIIKNNHTYEDVGVYTFFERLDNIFWVCEIDHDISSQVWTDSLKKFENNRIDVKSDGHAGDGYYLQVIITSPCRNPVMLSFSNSGDFIIKENVRIHSGTLLKPKSFEMIQSDVIFYQDVGLSAFARKQSKNPKF